MLADVRHAAPNYEPLIVGAMARDLLLHYQHGVPVARATVDIDLAFAVADWHEFHSLRQALLSTTSFTPGRPFQHRVQHRDGLPVDLIPFGGIERSDGSIVWPEDASVMGVLGYREARASAATIILPGGKTLFTVSLPMLAVLKVFAWSERHLRSPRKDASDLFLILESYLEDEQISRLYTEAAHLLEAATFNFETAGAWLVGHDAKKSLLESSAQPERVLNTVNTILQTEVDVDGPLRLVGETGTAAEQSRLLLIAFQQGLMSEITSK